MTSLVQSLLVWLTEFTGSYGWSILLLTLLVRLLLVPIYLWQQRTQKGSAALQAEIKEVQAKSLYWLASNLFGLGQHYLVATRRPAVV